MGQGACSFISVHVLMLMLVYARTVLSCMRMALVCCVRTRCCEVFVCEQSHRSSHFSWFFSVSVSSSLLERVHAWMTVHVYIYIYI
jgi:hypothetical protein